MGMPYASNISREKFEEVLPLLQSVRKRTKPTTVDLYELFCAVLYLQPSLLFASFVQFSNPR